MLAITTKKYMNDKLHINKRIRFASAVRRMQAGFGVSVRLSLVMGALIFCSGLAAQSVVSPQGSEYLIGGSLPGDQVDSAIAYNPAGNKGLLVWSDNHTDNDQSGISAIRITSSGSSEFEKFRINSVQEHHQEKPAVAYFNDGSAIVVWQSGEPSKQQIHARFLATDGTFVNESDIVINTHRATGKLSPSVASLSNGNAVVGWTSIGQDDSGSFSFLRKGLKGVYAQIVDSNGNKIGTEIQLNTTVAYNQRSVKVQGLGNGNFAAVWVSEKVFNNITDVQAVDEVDVFLRLFSNEGAPLTGEIKVNQTTNVCANPSLSVSEDNKITVAWSEKNLSNPEDSWDVKSKVLNSLGQNLGQEQLVNSFTYGDQFAPQVVSNGGQELILWTSLGQDGSWEGVYGRILNKGIPTGDSFQVNEQTVSKQMMPSGAAYLDNGFLVVWSSFVGGVGSIDLMAKRFSPSIPPASVPLVTALSPYELMVAWQPIEGFDVDTYLVYLEGASNPIETENNFYKVEDLNPGQSLQARLAYKLSNGIISPVSEVGIGMTWGRDANYNGLPDDWEQLYFGEDKNNWPAGNMDSDGDGVSNINEFFAGTNPTDINDAIIVKLESGTFGWNINWKTKAGNVYRVQKSNNFNEWNDITGYRFAPGSSDSVSVETTDGLGYFRVIMER